VHEMHKLIESEMALHVRMVVLPAVRGLFCA